MSKEPQWHHNSNPPAPGVYERLLDGVLGVALEQHFSLWTGKVWMRMAATPALAAQQTGKSLFNARPWAWRTVEDEASTSTLEN